MIKLHRLFCCFLLMISCSASANNGTFLKKILRDGAKVDLPKKKLGDYVPLLKSKAWGVLKQVDHIVSTLGKRAKGIHAKMPLKTDAAYDLKLYAKNGDPVSYLKVQLTADYIQTLPKIIQDQNPENLAETISEAARMGIGFRAIMDSLLSENTWKALDLKAIELPIQDNLNLMTRMRKRVYLKKQILNMEDELARLYRHLGDTPEEIKKLKKELTEKNVDKAALQKDLDVLTHTYLKQIETFLLYSRYRNVAVRQAERLLDTQFLGSAKSLLEPMKVTSDLIPTQTPKPIVRFQDPMHIQSKRSWYGYHLVLAPITVPIWLLKNTVKGTLWLASSSIKVMLWLSTNVTRSKKLKALYDRIEKIRTDQMVPGVSLNGSVYMVRLKNKDALAHFKNNLEKVVTHLKSFTGDEVAYAVYKTNTLNELRKLPSMKKHPNVLRGFEKLMDQMSPFTELGKEARGLIDISQLDSWKALLKIEEEFLKISKQLESTPGDKTLLEALEVQKSAFQTAKGVINQTTQKLIYEFSEKGVLLVQPKRFWLFRFVFNAFPGKKTLPGLMSQHKAYRRMLELVRGQGDQRLLEHLQAFDVLARDHIWFMMTNRLSRGQAERLFREMMGLARGEQERLLPYMKIMLNRRALIDNYPELARTLRKSPKTLMRRINELEVLLKQEDFFKNLGKTMDQELKVQIDAFQSMTKSLGDNNLSNRLGRLSKKIEKNHTKWEKGSQLKTAKEVHKAAHKIHQELTSLISEQFKTIESIKVSADTAKTEIPQIQLALETACTQWLGVAKALNSDSLSIKLLENQLTLLKTKGDYLAAPDLVTVHQTLQAEAQKLLAYIQQHKLRTFSAVLEQANPYQFEILTASIAAQAKGLFDLSKTMDPHHPMVKALDDLNKQINKSGSLWQKGKGIESLQAVGQMASNPLGQRFPRGYRSLRLGLPHVYYRLLPDMPVNQMNAIQFRGALQHFTQTGSATYTQMVLKSFKQVSDYGTQYSRLRAGVGMAAWTKRLVASCLNLVKRLSPDQLSHATSQNLLDQAVKHARRTHHPVFNSTPEVLETQLKEILHSLKTQAVPQIP